VFVVQVFAERGEPPGLAWSVLDVGGDQVIRSLPRTELLLYALVEFRVEEGSGYLDIHALLLLEVREARVERIVHRSADQENPQLACHSHPPGSVPTSRAVYRRCPARATAGCCR